MFKRFNLGIFLLIVLLVSWTQAMGEKQIIKSGVGSITAAIISENRLVINEYDLDTGEYLDSEYFLDPKVEIKNVKELKEIAANDNVEFKYIEKETKKIIKFVIIDKLKPEEKVIDGQGYPEEYTPDELNSRETAPTGSPDSL